MFDVAGNVLLVDVVDGAEAARQELVLSEETPRARAMCLFGTGVDVLVCGAISRALGAAVAAVGIKVIDDTCGDVECVLEAFREGRLGQPAFRMPGCCGRRRGRRRRRGARGEASRPMWE